MSSTALEIKNACGAVKTVFFYYCLQIVDFCDFQCIHGTTPALEKALIAYDTHLEPIRNGNEL